MQVLRSTGSRLQVQAQALMRPGTYAGQVIMGAPHELPLHYAHTIYKYPAVGFDSELGRHYALAT